MSIKSILFGAEQSTSTTGQMTPTDWRKVIRHWLVVIAGAAVSAAFSEAANSVLPVVILHLPPLVVAMGLTPFISAALEAARRRATDYLSTLATQ